MRSDNKQRHNDETYYNTARPDLISVVYRLRRQFNFIIDIGCGNGANLKNVADNLKVPYEHTLGIELLPHEFLLDTVKVVDIEKEEIELPGIEGKLILLLDVLEHLSNPWEFLEKLKHLLKSNDSILVSLPNLRCVSTSLRLMLLNDFKYENSGIRDRTHLRFFTSKSAAHSFGECGYDVSLISYRNTSKIMSLCNLVMFNQFPSLFHRQFYLHLVKKVEA